MARKPATTSYDLHSKQTQASRYANWGICLALVASVAAAYWPILGHDFVNFDDPDYVTENSWVKKGITWEGLQWAFNVGHASNWHPVTWLSHMLDCQLFGLKAGWHHLTSGLFHAANALLLFGLLRLLTGSRWRSALVAGLFALHPLHVESVAWLSERKDVLSTFFGLLCLMAYARYAESRVEGRESRGRSASHAAGDLREPEVSGRNTKVWYVTALVLLGLGLMSKPMLVTWPFVVLLLDYWPLNRFRLESNVSSLKFWALNRKIILEKIPFIALALGSSFMTFIAQRQGGAVAGLDSLPLVSRIQNATISYAGYLQKMFWPADLAAYYPLPASISFEKFALSGFILLSVSGLAFFWLRKRPYFMVGWSWYLGMLVPVIGIVQVGFQSMADRYTYLSLTGPFIMLIWGIEEITRPWQNRRSLAFAVGITLLTTCGFLTSVQARYWETSETLHRRTLAVTTRNAVTHLNLGSALLVLGRMPEAAEQFSEALKIRPDYAEARSNLGFALATQGHFEEAILQLRASLQSKPFAKTYFLLGNTLNLQGKTTEAIVEYRQALEIDPNQPGALNDLAWILATHSDADMRNGNEAVQLAERACKLLEWREPMFLGTLAAAYAEAGRFDAAIRTGEQARQLAERNGLKDLAARNAQLVKEYQLGKAHRESTSGK